MRALVVHFFVFILIAVGCFFNDGTVLLINSVVNIGDTNSCVWNLVLPNMFPWDQERKMKTPSESFVTQLQMTCS